MIDKLLTRAPIRSGSRVGETRSFSRAGGEGRRDQHCCDGAESTQDQRRGYALCLRLRATCDGRATLSKAAARRASAGSVPKPSKETMATVDPPGEERAGTSALTGPGNCLFALPKDGEYDPPALKVGLRRSACGMAGHLQILDCWSSRRDVNDAAPVETPLILAITKASRGRGHVLIEQGPPRATGPGQ